MIKNKHQECAPYINILQFSNTTVENVSPVSLAVSFRGFIEISKFQNKCLARIKKLRQYFWDARHILTRDYSNCHRGLILKEETAVFFLNKQCLRSPVGDSFNMTVRRMQKYQKPSGTAVWSRISDVWRIFRIFTVFTWVLFSSSFPVTHVSLVILSLSVKLSFVI